MTIFRKIVSVVMAFIVLFSTMSFTVDMHYCGHRLVDASIFGKAKTCGMQMQKPKNFKKETFTQKSCCTNKQFVIAGQTDLTPTFFHLSSAQQLFLVSFVTSYINLFEGLDKTIIPFKDYIPPLVVRDIHKLDETYLI